MLIQQREVTENPLLEGLDPLLRRVYASRDIRVPEQLLLDISVLLPPQSLKGIGQAVDLLYSMLKSQGRILIVSDFDADGATSCALAIRALSGMGFLHVDYIVPDRFAYGYGLSPAIVAMANERAPDLIITVDNGISSHEGVKTAHEFGIKVLITDHHLPGAHLPEADAIVNPNQPDCQFVSKALAGVGVVFYLMLALRAQLRLVGWFETQQIADPRLADLLDLVALGTVADLVALDHNNRILVNEGLRRIRHGRSCPGILALLEVGRRSPDTMVAADLGFTVGPRLNAAGRLEDMSLGIACLLTDDHQQAKTLANRLNSINEERKRIEGEMKEQALQGLASMQTGLWSVDSSDNTKLPAGLCLYDAKWHQGVVGIVAARVKELYHRPVIVFADASSDGSAVKEIKGSARSIPGLHIRDVLDEIASQNPGLVSKFGGHAMAAGLSLEQNRFEEFRSAFELAVSRHLDEADLHRRLLTDGELPASAIKLETAKLIRSSGPWGQGFPEPLFDGIFECLSTRKMGDKHLKFVVSPPGQRMAIDAVMFNVPEESLNTGAVSRIRLVYRLDVNDYRGQEQLQLMVEYFEPL